MAEEPAVVKKLRKPFQFAHDLAFKMGVKTMPKVSKGSTTSQQEGKDTFERERLIEESRRHQGLKRKMVD